MKVQIGAGGNEITWNDQGQTVRKSYSDTLLGYEVLPDRTGILVLEPVSQAGPENAVIFDANGTERWRLPFPKYIGVGTLFDRVGVSDGRLVVLGIVNGRDVKFEVDYQNLKYTDISAAR